MSEPVFRYKSFRIPGRPVASGATASLRSGYAVGGLAKNGKWPEGEEYVWYPETNPPPGGKVAGGGHG